MDRSPRGEHEPRVSPAPAGDQLSGWQGEVKSPLSLSSRRLTLALRCEAAVASAKPAGTRIGEHHAKPASGFVSFNAVLAVFVFAGGLVGCHGAAGGHRVGNGEGNGP